MNKRLKSISCLLAATCTFIVLENTIKLGPLGVDVVSAASETTTTTQSGSTNTSYTSNGYRTLKLGSTGSDVKSLQTALNNNGSKLVVDGFFGNLTLAAVKDYQKAKGLVVDGIVGPKTLAVLVPSSAVPTAIVKSGSSSNDVKYLQTNLNKLGYKLTVDGVFGKLTLAAVKDFQKANGLAVDGIAGPKTFGKLFEKTTTPATPTTPTTPTPPPTTTPDVVASASVVDNADALQKAMVPKDKGGDWIICLTKDVTGDKALTLDGEFINKHTPAAVQRKIALYTQDDKRVVTGRFTLTAPKLTILSPNASIEHGTFKGDIYVSAPGFKLINTIVDGNIYFTNKAAKDTFTIADSATDPIKTDIKGVQADKHTADVDVVATASIVNNTTDFEKAISKDGKWIIAVLDNLTFTKAITLDGVFNNTKTPPAEQRKLALYAHAEDKTTDARFTLTAPKLIVNSPTASIQHGTFVGDVYVNAANFSLVDAIVDGNIYFANQAVKDTFKMDYNSAMTGKLYLETK